MAVSPEDYRLDFDELIPTVVAESAKRVPTFAARLAAAGLTPADITGAEALDRVPILTKDEVIDHQTKDPPFGGLLATDAPIRRVFQSPGPIYEPELDEPDPWRWGPALDAAGFGQNDIVLNAFSYHLTPAGAMFDDAARVIGCRVVPAGVGSQDLQIRACRDLGITAYIGLPSYLKALVETAGDTLGIVRAFVSGEPLPASLRDWLRQHVPTVLQGYGTAELGNIAFECEQMNGLHVAPGAFVEVCGLDDGRARWDGGIGQVVVTLFRSDYPMIRFGTGDLSAVALGDCACGIPTPRLVGWLGRVGEAVKVRGMFLHPRQVEQVMADVRDVERYRFQIDRVDHRDVLRCEIALTRSVDEDAARVAVRDRVRAGLRFDVDVTVVDSVPDGPTIVDIRTWD